MKKYILAILGTALVFSACNKNDLPMFEQNPYRTIIEYTPQTFTMEVPGTLTPVAQYDWLTVSQSGNTATFTARRNTQDLIRRAEFTASGSKNKVIVNQKAHGLDATVTTSLVSQSKGAANIAISLSSEYPDDYASWGIVYGTTADRSAGKVAPQTGVPTDGKLEGEITGLEDGADYFVWTYIESTEGDKIYSDVLAIIPPVYFEAGQDLQTVLQNAKEYAEIRIPGGITIDGPIYFTNSCCNKTISGGWNADFSEQSMDNLTVIDGKGSRRGIQCSESETSFGPLTAGYAGINYFEIKNCLGDHGSAIHICGGPVNISNCYVHGCQSEKGAIGTREEDYSSTLTCVNCIVSDNIAYAHGAAFGFGDGVGYGDEVHATLVSNLIVNNTSLQKDGYCSAFICYSWTELIFVNNTLYQNNNYEEYGGEYPGLNLRGNVKSLFANNLMVGNYTSSSYDDPPVYHPMEQFLGMGGGSGTLAYNIIECSSIGDSGNASLINNTLVAPGTDVKTYMVDPAGANYMPVGAAIGGGTLGKINYKENMDTDYTTLNIASLLETYSKDMAGNPRVVDGKVDIGCYQTQK